MSDFTPPSGPPPPRVPEGWKAVYNAQYSQYFFVNIHTKESTWEQPTGPAPNPNSDHPPDAPPPGYTPGQSAPATAGQDVKRAAPHDLQSNNPYQQNVAESDEALARRLQEEENTRHGGSTDRSRTGFW